MELRQIVKDACKKNSELQSFLEKLCRIYEEDIRPILREIYEKYGVRMEFYYDACGEKLFFKMCGDFENAIPMEALRYIPKITKICHNKYIHSLCKWIVDLLYMYNVYILKIHFDKENIKLKGEVKLQSNEFTEVRPIEYSLISRS